MWLWWADLLCSNARGSEQVFDLNTLSPILIAVCTIILATMYFLSVFYFKFVSVSEFMVSFFFCRLLKPGGVYMLVICTPNWGLSPPPLFLFVFFSLKCILYNLFLVFHLTDNLWWSYSKDATSQPTCLWLENFVVHYTYVFHLIIYLVAILCFVILLSWYDCFLISFYFFFLCR